MLWRGLSLAMGLLAACGAQAAYIPGIDVSNFQGMVNWTSVRNAGYKFAFCKATEGVDFVDAKFTTNMTNAKAAGVPIGPYHFARPDSNVANPLDAANEANDFVDAIAPYYAQTSGHFLRPVLDVERLTGAATIAAEKVALSQWVRNFAAVVKSRLGMDPIIYCNVNYATTYFESDIGAYDLWLAKWTYNTANPPTSANDGVFNGWEIWQWSDNTSVPGITGAVDGNVYDGTQQQLLGELSAKNPGDFNRNGVVDAADYTLYRDTLGSTTDLRADGDVSLGVTSADYPIWSTNFNIVQSTVTIVRPASAVPEPAAVVVGLALLAVGRAPLARRG